LPALRGLRGRSRATLRTLSDLTYNSPERITGENTYGGYSDSIVVREEFVLHVRHQEQDLAAVAPLLCAGITMWSPLRHWKVGKGQKIGIIGIGGLGHMGIKLAHALGAHVAAFTTSVIDIARRQGGEALRTARDDRDPPEALRDLQLVHQGFDTAGEQVVKRSDDRR
jgi:D-arabinose 1-dehydrogenase-like Zn-dependent alcohol dehydrogenase